MAQKQRSKVLEIFRDWKLVMARVRKPERHELVQAVKVVFLGLVLVGSVAYIIHLVAVMLLGGI